MAISNLQNVHPDLMMFYNIGMQVPQPAIYEFFDLVFEDPKKSLFQAVKDKNGNIKIVFIVTLIRPSTWNFSILLFGKTSSNSLKMDNINMNTVFIKLAEVNAFIDLTLRFQ